MFNMSQLGGDLSQAADAAAARALCGVEPSDDVEISLTIPAGLGWNSTAYPLTFSLLKSRDSYRAKCSHTAPQLFGLFSTALSAPGTALYVDVAIPDGGNNGLTWGTAYNKIWEAVQAANTAGLPATIFVRAGDYSRSRNPCNGTPSTIYPTVDVALIAVGGRVRTGTWDQYTAPSLDVTYTLCYALAVATVDRIVDMRAADEHGLFPDLLQVSSAALANATPGSYFHNGTTAYIRRADGLPVTNANTRVYRGTAGVLRSYANKASMFLGGAESGSGFDLEGSDGYAVFSALALDNTFGPRRAVVADSCSFRYGGGGSSGLRNGVGINGIHGIAAFFNCSADRNASDGFNCHQNLLTGGAQSAFLTINTASRANGDPSMGNVSCNGYTLHEDVIGIDVGGDHGWTHGGSVRNIDASKCWIAGAVIGPDFGDVRTGGQIRGDCVRVDNTSEIWLERIAFRAPPSGISISATSGATARYRDLAPGLGSLVATGTGVIAPY